VFPGPRPEEGHNVPPDGPVGPDAGWVQRVGPAAAAFG